jgi:type IV secretion system protein VirB9
MHRLKISPHLHFLKLISCLAIFSTFSLGKAAFAQSSVPITTDSRIKTLVYNPNEVYQLKFHYGYQSFIEFADDEEIEMISIGESFAWRLTPAGKRIFIRPLEIAAHTNMAIITNKRTYQFDIRSGEYNGKADEELVYTIRFYYPEFGAALPIPPQLSSPPPPPPRISRFGVKTSSSPVRIDKNLPDDLKIDAVTTKLNFDYSFAGIAENITPLKIYDNGRETYFQFKSNNLIIPTISVVDKFGNERPLNHIMVDNYVMVPTVGRQFTLRLADSLLCVFNNNGVQFQ